MSDETGQEIADALDEVSNDSVEVEENTVGGLPEEADKIRDVNQLEGLVEAEQESLAPAAAPVPKTFYRVEVFTGSEWVSLDVEDPQEANNFANNVVRQGTYTTQIENGIEVYPAKRVKVTGPFEVQ